MGACKSFVTRSTNWNKPRWKTGHSDTSDKIKIHCIAVFLVVKMNKHTEKFTRNKTFKERKKSQTFHVETRETVLYSMIELSSKMEKLEPGLAHWRTSQALDEMMDTFFRLTHESWAAWHRVIVLPSLVHINCFELLALHSLRSFLEQAQ